MGTYTVRPTSSGAAAAATGFSRSDDLSSWLTSATAQQVAARLGDSSDSTAVRATNTTAALASVTGIPATAPSIGADEFVAYVGVSIRHSHGTGLNQLGADLYLPSSGPWTNTRFSAGSTVKRTDTVVTPAGWANLAGLAWWVAAAGHATAASRPWIYDVWATAYTLEIPTVTVGAVTVLDGSSGTLAGTVTAVTGWEHTLDGDAYGLASDQWLQVPVAWAVAKGGDWNSPVASGIETVTVTEAGTTTVDWSAVVPDLEPGTYQARVCPGRFDIESPRGYVQADGVWWGSWGTPVAYVVAPSTPPAAPTAVTVTAVDTTQYVSVAVTVAAESGFTARWATVERSDDGGVTWIAPTTHTLPGAAGGTVYRSDWWAPRGQTVRYRARVSGTTSVGGFTVVSGWTVAAGRGPAADGWNLKPVPFVLTAANVLTGATVLGPVEDGPFRDVAVLRPTGRALPVTMTTAAGGWDGDLVIACHGDDDWNRLRGMIETPGVYLLESPYGWARWIAITGARVSTRGTPTAARRTVTLATVEVEVPAGAR